MRPYVKNLCLLIFISATAFEHSLPCKFVLAEDQNFSANLGDYLALILRPAVLQNMLNHVVAVLILREAVQTWARGKAAFCVFLSWEMNYNQSKKKKKTGICAAPFTDWFSCTTCHHGSESVWDKSCRSTMIGRRMSDTPICSFRVTLTSSLRKVRQNRCCWFWQCRPIASLPLQKRVIDRYGCNFFYLFLFF